ncbi:MAG TPA: hypothetical protein VII95_06845, partial [Terriglobales bacterium]
SAGAAAEPAASQGLRVTELVASSWKLNFELSLGESAEYCPKRSGTSAHGLKAVRDDNSEIAKTGHNLCSTQ